MIRVEAAPFYPAAELAALIAAHPHAGAVVSFTGAVRAEDGGVTALELMHYPGFTERMIAGIADAARQRFALDGLFIVHRHGLLQSGEPIVFTGAAARHRRVAFDAVDYLMDRLKTEAPFWKREHGPAGTRWIEAREEDWADRGRWD